jgi:hypothetical protein
MDLSTYKVAEELVADIATAEAEQSKVLRHMAELGKVAEDEEVFVTLTHMDKGERTSVCLNMPQKYVVYMLELYERNPEAREYCMNYPLEYGKEHEIDISGYADYEGVPLFIQWDKQWGYKDYIGSVGGLSACGPTCLSMVTYYFTRDPEMTPAYMMDFAEENEYGLKGAGTQWSLFKLGAKKLGLDMKELNADQMTNEAYIADVLDSGRIIVMNVKPGVFTTVGHYMLIVGYEDGKFKLNDPNSPANSEKLWDFDEFDQDIKIMWSFSG